MRITWRSPPRLPKPSKYEIWHKTLEWAETDYAIKKIKCNNKHMCSSQKKINKKCDNNMGNKYQKRQNY